MIRYTLLSVFALLLPTACGGNDLKQLKQSQNSDGAKECMKCDLTGANLAHAQLAYVDLTGANLSVANLAYTDLTGANLYRSDLTSANLAYADLTDADLTWADLKRAYLADVIGANFTGALNGESKYLKD
jgi:uncharacterized protein YjbI with pentapeptide repeats